MTARTRYFVIVSLLVLGIGLGTGLVAYYVGFPAGAFAPSGGPAELRLVPRDATLIDYANVHDVMTSELRQKLHRALPSHENGREEIQNQTGINIETDVDRIFDAHLLAGEERADGSQALLLARPGFTGFATRGFDGRPAF